MPKKFVGENSKAVVARARKAAVKEAETERKTKEAEDRAWQDDDKQLAKRKQKQVSFQTLLNCRTEFYHSICISGGGRKKTTATTTEKRRGKSSPRERVELHQNRR